MKMIIKTIKDEDYDNYKKPSMVVGFPRCSFKCDKECGQQVCQNSVLATAQDIDIPINDIVDRYLDNNLTSALVCGGLEPFDSFDCLLRLISQFRGYTLDDIVIYTGYNRDEIIDYITCLRHTFQNIVIKFGRFVPGQEKHYDEVLGVYLASSNQGAEKIS